MKIHCPFHSEKTPSLAVYENGYHCFGCNKTGKHEELDALGISYKDCIVPLVKADLPSDLEYIKNLPQKEIRGLTMPYDHEGYFIVWPGKDYYIKRQYDKEPKYYAPKGLSRPLFRLHSWPMSKQLIIVEGEVNALSIKKALPNYCVISPGSAGNFAKRGGRDALKIYMMYEKLHIVTDYDKPGATGARDLANALIKTGYDYNNIHFNLMKPDANDILVSHGEEALKNQIQKALDLQTQVSLNGDPLPSLRTPSPKNGEKCES